MDEARKSNRLRGEALNLQLFSGSVIDIGCGPDLVVPHATPFDLEHGDAQRILDYFPPQSFDCVHSSHCLEHMRDPAKAIAQWWGLVKVGGHMVTVVPDEDLYEQGFWPSLFNGDHKATFRIAKRESWSLVSHDIGELVAALPGAEIVEARVQDDGYDRRLMRKGGGQFARLMFRFGSLRAGLVQRLMRLGVPLGAVNRAFDTVERALGRPIDQTLGPAVAQIQVIARKTPFGEG